MPKIIPSAQLRNDYNGVSGYCRESSELVYVTENGSGDMVVLSVDAFEALVARAEISEALSIGRADVRAGRVRPARDVVASLRERYGDVQ